MMFLSTLGYCFEFTNWCKARFPKEELAMGSRWLMDFDSDAWTVCNMTQSLLCICALAVHIILDRLTHPTMGIVAQIKARTTSSLLTRRAFFFPCPSFLLLLLSSFWGARLLISRSRLLPLSRSSPFHVGHAPSYALQR